MTPYEIGQLAALEKVAFWPALAPLASAATGAFARMGGMAAVRAAMPGLAKNMLVGGAMSGGLNALTADPGDRMGAAARGFGWGAVGGAAFQGVQSGMKAVNALPKMNAWRQGGGMLGSGLRRAATNPTGLAFASGMALPTGAKVRSNISDNDGWSNLSPKIALVLNQQLSQPYPAKQPGPDPQVVARQQNMVDLAFTTADRKSGPGDDRSDLAPSPALNNV